MNVDRVLTELALLLETHVIVAMRGLCLSTRIDEIDLSGDLIERAQPGTADHRKYVVGVVARVQIRRQHAQLLMRVPDAGIGTRLGKMISLAATDPRLLGDDLQQHVADAIDQIHIGECPAENHQARTIKQNLMPFSHIVIERLGIISNVPQSFGIVDRNIALYLAGERILLARRHELDNSLELIKRTTVVRHPDIAADGIQLVKHVHDHFSFSSYREGQPYKQAAAYPSASAFMMFLASTRSGVMVLPSN